MICLIKIRNPQKKQTYTPSHRSKGLGYDGWIIWIDNGGKIMEKTIENVVVDQEWVMLI